tara:strand:+ start:385 stop:552 length:168 start_codon:yes stop_codon:yes gene_type:complete
MAKEAKNEVEIKDQGSVPLKKQEVVPNPGAPKPFGSGESRGGGIALRGKKFQGIF